MGTPSKSPEPEWYIYKATVLFNTSYIAPALSPNKAMKKLQIEDIKRCYSEETGELVEHLDRAFYRDAQCNAIVPGHVLSASLREQLKKGVIVRGSVTIPKELIRIGTVKANNSLTNFEYVPAGTVTNSLLQINTQMPEKVIIYTGARKLKGFGRIEITFKPTTNMPDSR